MGVGRKSEQPALYLADGVRWIARVSLTGAESRALRNSLACLILFQTAETK